jgi:hypothetical protein
VRPQLCLHAPARDVGGSADALVRCRINAHRCCCKPQVLEELQPPAAAARQKAGGGLAVAGVWGQQGFHNVLHDALVSIVLGCQRHPAPPILKWLRPAAVCTPMCSRALPCAALRTRTSAQQHPRAAARPPPAQHCTTAPPDVGPPDAPPLPLHRPATQRAAAVSARRARAAPAHVQLLQRCRAAPVEGARSALPPHRQHAAGEWPRVLAICRRRACSNMGRSRRPLLPAAHPARAGTRAAAPRPRRTGGPGSWPGAPAGQRAAGGGPGSGPPGQSHEPRAARGPLRETGVAVAPPTRQAPAMVCRWVAHSAAAAAAPPPPERMHAARPGPAPDQPPLPPGHAHTHAHTRTSSVVMARLYTQVYCAGRETPGITAACWPVRLQQRRRRQAHVRASGPWQQAGQCVEGLMGVGWGGVGWVGLAPGSSARPPTWPRPPP